MSPALEEIEDFYPCQKCYHSQQIHDPGHTRFDRDGVSDDRALFISISASPSSRSRFRFTIILGPLFYESNNDSKLDKLLCHFSRVFTLPIVREAFNNLPSTTPDDDFKRHSDSSSDRASDINNYSLFSFVS